MNGSNSVICKNLNFLASKIVCNRNEIFSKNAVFLSKITEYVNNMYSEDDFITTSFILKEIMYTRDVNNTNMTFYELTDTINLLCTQ